MSFLLYPGVGAYCHTPVFSLSHRERVGVRAVRMTVGADPRVRPFEEVNNKWADPCVCPS